MDFSFRTDYNFFFILLLFAVSVSVSYIYYNHSKLEPIPKKVFTLLRFLSVFFILLLLLSPVLSYVKNTTEIPLNVIIIDNSKSMTINDRQEILRKMLNEKILNAYPGNAENRYFLFSEDLNNEIREEQFSSLNFNGSNVNSTNLNSSVNSLKEKFQNSNLSSVTVISDGIINEGGLSASTFKSMNVPFNYILIGDTVQKKDAAVKNIYYNKSAFIESSVPVKAEIIAFDINKDITVDLFEENNLIDSKIIQANNDNFSYVVSFNVSSAEEAIKKYRIEVKGSDDEITLKNNSEEFYIKYTDNKFRVLVISGGPGPDFAFLKEETEQIRNFETSFLTQKSQTEFYENLPSDLGAFDSYIFAGYPTAVTNLSVLNELSEKIKKNNSTLIFFNGRNVDLQKLSLLEDKLPFKIIRISDTELETGIKSVVSLNQDIFRNSELLSSVNNLPNIFRTGSEFSVNPTAESYMVMSRNSEPAFVFENSDTKKSAAFLPYGFFKWRLNSQKNRSEELLRYMISNSIVSLTGKESGNKFSIETDKPVYSESERINFKGTITNYEIKGGEQLKVSVSGNNYDSSFYLTKRSGKYFESEIRIPLKGDYKYTAELSSSNGTEQSIAGRFSVDENNFEFKDTKSDNTFLSMLSNETKGFNFSNMESGDIKDSLNVINEKSRTEYKTQKNFNFDVNPYYLAILIFLLCLEWFLRKRFNLS